jgi:DedD protein
MTFYDTLTKTPPRAKARTERKAQVSQPKNQAAKKAKARVARSTVKEKKPTTRKRTERTAKAATQPEKSVWSVQVKAFARQRDASDLAKRLKGKGYDAYVVSIQIKGRTWYRVRVGHLATQREAQGLLLKLKREEKYTRAIITRGG